MEGTLIILLTLLAALGVAVGIFASIRLHIRCRELIWARGELKAYSRSEGVYLRALDLAAAELGTARGVLVQRAERSLGEEG